MEFIGDGKEKMKQRFDLAKSYQLPNFYNLQKILDVFPKELCELALNVAQHSPFFSRAAAVA